MQTALLIIYTLGLSWFFLLGFYLGQRVEFKKEQMESIVESLKTKITKKKGAVVGTVKAPTAEDLRLKNTVEGQTEEAMAEFLESIQKPSVKYYSEPKNYHKRKSVYKR